MNINMKKIISLTKNKNGLYDVLIDDEILTVDEETVLKYRLFKNNEIDVKDFDLIRHDDFVYKISNKMLEYRLKYNKSINEIKRHFLSKEIDENIVCQAIELLISKKLINDQELALMICTSLARNSNGYYLIKEKLKQRLFNDNIINYALENLKIEDINYGKEKLVIKLEKKYLKEEDKIKKYKIKKQLYNHGYKVDE